MVAPGHEPGPRGTAKGSGDIPLREANAVLREGIDMGSWNFFVSLATELAVSKIVSNEEDDVGHILSEREGESAG